MASFEPGNGAGIVKQSGLFERFVYRTLQKFTFNAAGNLLVTPSATPNMTTLGTLTNITNWGLRTATSITQQETMNSYQMGYRRNLIKS